MKYQEVSVSALRPGSHFMGRGGWWITVDSTRLLGSDKVEIRGVNAFGDPVVMRYKDSAKVWVEVV